MTARRWVTAGPLLVGFPVGPPDPRPDHEAQAVVVSTADPKRRVIQDHGDDGRLVTGIPCSREEWASVVERIKAGDLDIEWPP